MQRRCESDKARVEEDRREWSQLEHTPRMGLQGPERAARPQRQSRDGASASSMRLEPVKTKDRYPT